MSDKPRKSIPASEQTVEDGATLLDPAWERQQRKVRVISQCSFSCVCAVIHCQFLKSKWLHQTTRERVKQSLSWLNLTYLPWIHNNNRQRCYVLKIPIWFTTYNLNICDYLK